jgi:RTX calcium-binding nonapeptide repeat (4 copies)/FG-GAP repeat
MPSITGTQDNDNLTGTLEDDIIYGLGGDDIINDLDGNDVVDGGDGNDIFNDGAGTDTFRGGAGFDIFRLAGANTLVDGGLNFGAIEINGYGPPAASGYPPSSFKRGSDGLVFVIQNQGNQTITNITRYQTLRYFNDGGIASTYHLLDTKDDMSSDGDSDLIYLSRSSGELGYGHWDNNNTFVTTAIEQMDFTNWVVQGVGYIVISGDSTFPVLPDSNFIIKNELSGEFRMSAYTPSEIDVTKYYQFVPIGITDVNLDIVTMADTNGDLIDEIVWRDRRDGTIFVNKVGNLNQQVSFGSLGVYWNAPEAGDFDNDGDEDILLRNDQTGQVYIYYMQDGLKSGSSAVATFGADWNIAGTGDFNDDHFTDIALRNDVTGQLYLALMDGNGGYTGSNLGNVDLDWAIKKVGDYNGDGTGDLMWRNGTTNQVYLWAMQDGHQAVTGSAPYGYLAADQVIV